MPKYPQGIEHNESSRLKDSLMYLREFVGHDLFVLKNASSFEKAYKAHTNFIEHLTALVDAVDNKQIPEAAPITLDVLRNLLNESRKISPSKKYEIDSLYRRANEILPALKF